VYLAWGNLSIKQVYQAAKSWPKEQKNSKAMAGFLSRVKWHDHFVQKFEQECAYEFRAVNRAFEDLGAQNNEQLLRDWFEKRRAKYDEPARYDFQEAVLDNDNSEAIVRAFVAALNAGAPGDARAGLRGHTLCAVSPGGVVPEPAPGKAARTPRAPCV
jgi:hypothetical protein